MRHIQRKVSVDICKSQTVLLNAVHDRASNSFPQIRWNQMICKRKSLIGELYTKNTSRQYVNTYLLGKWKISDWYYLLKANRCDILKRWSLIERIYNRKLLNADFVASGHVYCFTTIAEL